MHLWFCAVQKKQEKWHKFLRIFKWSPKKEKKEVFDLAFRWALWSPLGPLMDPFKLMRTQNPMNPLKSMGPGAIVPPAPLSKALDIGEK